MTDHEDYLPGEEPAAHRASHQNGGADEISVAGLSGETEELAAHKLLPTVHQDAPALIETHRLVADAHHTKYTDAEAEAQADAKIAIHAGLPTVHQDAPALIETHRLVADAHHTKYTDAEAEAQADAKIAIHAGLPTAHQDAPALIETHRLVADAHHTKYTDAEAEAQADAKIAIHAGLPTVHQDAPALIETHRLVADAHHTKYTDAEAEAQADAKIAIHAGLPTVHQDAPALIETHRLVADAHHTRDHHTRHEPTGADAVQVLGTLENDIVRIHNPGGGAFYAGASTTGAIQIKLPTVSDEMLSLEIRVYHYIEDGSFTLFVGGYPYPPTPRWMRTFAQMIATSPPTTAVRFGRNADSSEWYIIIGDITTGWEYVNVGILNLTAGFETALSHWNNGWIVSEITTWPPNIDRYIADARI